MHADRARLPHGVQSDSGEEFDDTDERPVDCLPEDQAPDYPGKRPFPNAPKRVRSLRQIARELHRKKLRTVEEEETAADLAPAPAAPAASVEPSPIDGGDQDGDMKEQPVDGGDEGAGNVSMVLADMAAAGEKVSNNKGAAAAASGAREAAAGGERLSSEVIDYIRELQANNQHLRAENAQNLRKIDAVKQVLESLQGNLSERPPGACSG